MRTLKKELWPVKVHVDSMREADNIEVWLSENLGPFRSRWNAVYGMLGTDFYFRNSKDALMFRLRWSE